MNRSTQSVTRLLWLAGVLGSLLSSQVLAQGGPSFDCEKAATTVERIICSNDVLATHDSVMARSYEETYNALGTNERKTLLADQRRWLNLRNAMCGIAPKSSLSAPYPSYLNECLKEIYVTRTGVLSGAGSVRKYLLERKDAVLQPGSTELHKKAVSEIVNRYTMRMADSDRVCEQFAEDLRTQKDVVFVAPIIVTEYYYDDRLRSYLDNCPKLEFRSPILYSPGYKKYYPAAPTLALFGVDKDKDLYVFLDQSFHYEWSKAEGLVLFGGAYYRPFELSQCKAPQRSQPVGGESAGYVGSEGVDFSRKDPVSSLHGMIDYQGKRYLYEVRIHREQPRSIVVSSIENAEIPQFRRKCSFELLEQRMD